MVVFTEVNSHRINTHPGGCFKDASWLSSQVIVWITQWPQLTSGDLFRYREGVPSQHIDVLEDQRR